MPKFITSDAFDNTKIFFCQLSIVSSAQSMID